MNKEGGSELHRLKTMDEYDERLFNKLYRKLKPLVKKLARNVDARRYNVSPDIIQSYFWDKFLYVFNKYQSEYDEQRLQATLINSLTTFKNRLLRKAYGEQSEYYQSLVSLDGLFDDNKEDIMDTDEREKAKERLESLYAFLRAKLKSDNSKISIVMLLDFFGLARTKTNSNYISTLRKEIDLWTKKAGEELK